MNSIEVWHMLNTVFLIFGVLLLVATIFEFFAFNIKKIFQDLTGITQKREIKAMSENTEYTGQLKHKTSFKKNEKIVSPSGKLNYAGGGSITGKLNKAHKKAVITPPPAPDNNAIYTAKAKDKMVSDENETDILKSHQTNAEADEATDILKEQQVNIETEVLQSSESETSVLSEVQIKINRDSISKDAQISTVSRREIHFLLERQILMTHTNEIIE